MPIGVYLHKKGVFKHSEETKKKISESEKGKKLSEETKRKMSKTRKRLYSEGKLAHPFLGRHHSEETKRKLSDAHKGEKSVWFGRHHTEETKLKMSEAQRGEKNHMYNIGKNHPMYGKHHSAEAKGKIGQANSIKRKGIKFSKEHRRKIGLANSRRKLSEETKRKISDKIKIISKKNWQNPEFVKKVMHGLHLKPTKPEKIIDELLNELSPNEWRYNGDFSQGITIGGRIPDFVNVNGKKSVIELFGEYWHSPLYNPKIKEDKTYEHTIEHYKKYGFDCLIVWDNELKEINRVRDKINSFFAIV